MSSMIVINEEKHILWSYQSGLYSYIMEATLEQIPESMPALRKFIEEHSVEQRGLAYLPLHECTLDDMETFLAMFRAAYQSRENEGAIGLHDPSYYPNVMKAFRKLISLVEEEVVRREADKVGQSPCHCRPVEQRS